VPMMSRFAECSRYARHRRCASASRCVRPVAVPSGRQFATEYAEVDPATIKEQYDSAPPNMQLALDVVRQSAPDRVTYEELELSSGGRAVGSVQSSVGGALGMGPSTHVHNGSTERAVNGPRAIPAGPPG
jgi:hypothetical protein